MIDEAVCLGRVLGVGESSRALIPHVTTLVFGPDNFDAKNPNMRPVGWTEARAKRVMIKEQIDRSMGVSEEVIALNHESRLDEVRIS
jgi:hypothetical protein